MKDAPPQQPKPPVRRDWETIQGVSGAGHRVRRAEHGATHEWGMP